MKLNKLVEHFKEQEFVNPKDIGLPDFDIEQLIAAGYVRRVYKDATNFDLAATDKLLSYNLQRKEETRQILKKNSFNLLMSIISAVFGSATTLLLQYIFTK